MTVPLSAIIPNFTGSLPLSDGYTFVYSVANSGFQLLPVVSDIGIGAYTSGPIDVNLTNAYRTTNYSGVRITSSTWYTNSSTVYKIFEVLYTYSGNAIVPTTVTQNLYASDGITIIHSIVDTITYTNNIFETARARTII